MSEENVEMLHSAYQAISRGDWDAAFEAVGPDFELVPPDQSPSSAPVRGVREVRAWFTDQQQMVGDLSVEVEELIEAGELIVALIRLRIRPHGADADFELRIAHLWTLRDRKLIRCEVIPEREKALEAAGLSE
ncbi:MAG: nuclear transport factor 2 family protein [Gemmatimonadota bacterium]